MNFDWVTNPHPTDFLYEMHTRRMRILAGSVTSLLSKSALHLRQYSAHTRRESNCHVYYRATRHSAIQNQYCHNGYV